MNVDFKSINNLRTTLINFKKKLSQMLKFGNTIKGQNKKTKYD